MKSSHLAYLKLNSFLKSTVWNVTSLVTENPLIFYAITLVAVVGIGPENGRCVFECLGILAPLLIRLIHDIIPGMKS